MKKFAPTLIVAGLLAATATAFAVTERLKLEDSPVFMTGGSSFVPAIRRIFEDKFSANVPIRVGQEFTSVAEGLAIYALELLEG